MIASSWLVIGVALPLRVLSLGEAVRTAQTRQPQVLQAAAATEVAWARVEQSRAPLLPQVTGTIAYSRSTGNYAPRAGSLPSSTPRAAANSFDTYNYFSTGVYVTQSLWDFGQTYFRWQSAKETAESSRESERTARAQVLLRVRTAFFQARAQKALWQVARDALGNQLRHRQQIEGFVEVGTRPSIDLAQARTDVANARLHVLNTETNYRTARAQLLQAMGVAGPLEFEVADDTLAAVPGEEGETEETVRRAIAARPETAGLERQLAAQEIALRAVKGAYWPSLGFSMSLTEAGSPFDAMAWNWSAGLNLSWPLFQGFLTRGQEREARATIDGLRAQTESLRQQVRLEVVQAQLQLGAAKAAITAAEQVVVNARERLRLAEGRYATGVGNSIELGDAQSVLTNAAGQRVIADFNLATARGQLLSALGQGK